MPEFSVPGGHLHYERAGAGPLLVVLHGIGSNSRSWRHQLSGLADAFTVVAWDARGYGQSTDPPGPWTMADYAHDLAALLHHLDAPRAHVLGLSMGGVMALEFYRHYPRRVRSLVLADTFCGGGALPAEERERRLANRLEPLERMTIAEFARARAPGLLSPTAAPALVEQAVAIMADLHPEGYRHAAVALETADVSDVLPTVAVPTLVLWGDEDRVLPRPHSERVHRGIRGARWAVVAGAGHASSQERPEAFNAVVRAFLESQRQED